ncbi:MAG: deoxyguanosinetriphosphate triphosphohydrolase [Clostridia bacterium]|nr:deoxyguanosinetriphosphate triphosphohydrolase [Clostridia bacterium]
MTIRERTEQIEKETLSEFATLSSETKGREKPVAKCEFRTEFQRDRDRIIHSKAFRRLKHKTQVFISPEGDHYRTRLTHTLEVAQIARTIARALRLNEDLTEAMALGHDLGHTPFGHAGERALRQICTRRFDHNIQSLRVVEKLEGGKGLNLTYEVRDGIANHTWGLTPHTLEGKILQFADRIAYINHDIDDAVRGKVIKSADLPEDSLRILGHSHSSRINTLISDVIHSSIGKNDIVMSDKTLSAMLELREFLRRNVYSVSSAAKTEEGKAEDIIKMLFEYYAEHLNEIPYYNVNKDKGYDDESIVTDYIAGMTDRYAIYIYSELFLPKGWYKH